MSTDPQELLPKKQPEPPPAPDEVVVTPPVEDAGTQALTEALSSSFKIVRFVMLLLLGVFLVSGSFIVRQGEVAVLLRFGKPVGVGAELVRQPGFYFAWPAPIDEVIKIKSGESLTLRSTTGWHSTSPQMEALGQEPPAMGFLNPASEGYAISADGNIFHARATVKYRVADPLRYRFGFADAASILTNIVNNAIVHAAARMTAEDALYKNKAGYRDLVMARVQEQVDELNLGITLEPGDVETKPPADVKRAFDDVIAAEQEGSKLVQEARGYHDEVTLLARGEAQALINAAGTQSNLFVQAVGAQAAAFTQMLPEYEKDPWLFRSRLLTARMERVLTNAQEKMFLPDLPPGQTRELRLQLSREPIERRAPARP
ncbi:MAG: protease modulator HflK [Verrucomicrobiae bacterium]|nr:protease modulator HflK [Verrucomicrobiae bacterium]MCP5523619.1 protease modulator HflK [Verrucomicrobiales bacterium]